MPTLPGEDALRAERAGFAATIAAMDDGTLESGPTLCAGWTPRDVVAHLLGVDDGLRDYLGLGWVGRGNARQVGRYRSMGHDELRSRVERWAAKPAAHVRAGAAFLIGDVSVHHQDVLRPNGIAYDVPAASARAVYREGIVLSGTRLLRNRLVPTDGLGRSVGVGTRVSGPALVLGLWLSGRDGTRDEIEIG